ncbi:MAG: amidohydrolase family protein [Deltaproteobacteria bacterium]|nr:amidohydrolase family protein [Deltaproteobacteria bacterium]
MKSVLELRLVLVLSLAALAAPACDCAGGRGDDTDGDADADADGDGDGDGDGDTDGDGDADPGPPVTDCETDLEPAADGACAVEAGDGNILIQGDVLTRDEVLAGGSVLIDEAGAIACVGCDCSGEGEAEGATRVVCAEGVVSPGLINAHDHLRYIQNEPQGHGDERYEHRHDWRTGRNGHTEVDYEGRASDEEVLWGELRQVLGGVTSVVGGDQGVAGLLRNLDDGAPRDEGLGQGRVDSSTFPLGDIGGETRDEGCAYPEIDSASVLGADAYVPHVSEGIDVEARNEFLCLTSGAAGGVDLAEANSAFVHSIPLNAFDAALLATNRTAVIWSPRTNIDLYGNTAPVTLLDRLGVTIALGTDWTVSGSINMLRELKCADSFNQENLDSTFGDWDLWEMATTNGARVTATDDAMGRLAVGLIADLAIFDASASEYFRAVIDAGPAEVALVLRGGEVLYGDAPVVSELPGGGEGSCEPLDVCGREKSVCVLGDAGVSLADLTAANSGSYDLFFCGDPDGEPSCAPFRPGEYEGAVDGDMDGDGVGDADDDCPSIFNPVRPVDGGLQADFDGDGEGDVCDRCPTSADNENCPEMNLDDMDGDGVDDDIDNCPVVPNDGQEDADSDGKGDACDGCPEDPNPGEAACPATIYQVKQEQFADGDRVALSGVVVTAVRGSAFYVQVPEADQDGELGTAYSGIYCYVPDANPDDVPVPSRGDLISLEGNVTHYQGEVELNFIGSLVTDASEQPLPAAEIVLAGDVGDGGARATELEAVLVAVQGAAVTAVDDPEFTLDDSLVVSDYIWAVEPQPQEDDLVDVTGILRVSNDGFRLNPRDEDDVRILLAGDPRLEAFGPAVSFVDEGDAGVVPRPDLRVSLDRPAVAGGTVISLESDSLDNLTVPASVTVPEGEREAQVTVTGVLGREAPVTITARLGDDSLTADVVVIAAGREPVLVDLAPDGADVFVGIPQTFTVTLDIPAQGATDVAIELDPGTFATLPGPTVTVPDGATTATFDVDGTAEGIEELTATLGESLSVTFTVNAGLDIGGWQLVQTNSARTFTFPEGTRVTPGAYVIVARNPADQAAFEDFWGAAFGPSLVFFSGGDDWPNMNGGETFELLDDDDLSIDGPTIALVEGHAYARTAPEDDPGVAGSWTDVVSEPPNATPGSGQTPSDDFSGLYISELSDATGVGNYVYEFVELYFD